MLVQLILFRGSISVDIVYCAIFTISKLFLSSLAQDPLISLLVMTEWFQQSLNIDIHDGDTSQQYRMLLRVNARMIF